MKNQKQQEILYKPPSGQNHEFPYRDLTLLLGALSGPLAAQCVDYSKDPAGCQPIDIQDADRTDAFRAHEREGKIDPKSSEADARAGAAKLEKELHLYRNFEQLHWVLTVPSVKDPANGAGRAATSMPRAMRRGLGIAGNCIFVGHGNGAGQKHAINIFKIQPHPDEEAARAGRRDPGDGRGQSGIRRS